MTFGCNWRCVAAFSVVITFMMGCSSGRKTVPGIFPSGQAVSVFGNSQAEISAAIDAAWAAHYIPRYIMTQAPKKSYLFAVDAQVFRTPNNLVVHAFRRIYVFPLSIVRTFYTRQPLEIASLPSIDGRGIDTERASNFLTADPVLSKNGCPDCVALLIDQNLVRQISALWNGKLDPWQMTPDYVVWTPPGIRPMYLQPAPPGVSPTAMPACGGAPCPANEYEYWDTGEARMNANPMPNGLAGGCNSSTDPSVNLQNTANSTLAMQFDQARARNQEAVNYFYADTNGWIAVGPTIWITPGPNGVAQLPGPPAVIGWSAIGISHTHPDDYTTTVNITGVDSMNAGAAPYNGSPAYSNTLFSVPDEAYANTWKIDMFVEVEAAGSRIDTTNPTPNFWMARWKNGGTIGQMGNYSEQNIGGPSGSGGTPSWTQC